MSRRLVFVITFTLLIGMLGAAVKVQRVEASGTIYIRADGSVEGTDKIRRDGDLYTFTDNIYDSIVVERNNIVVDGAGYTLQGMGIESGFYLSGINNVIIQNTNTNNFRYGVSLSSSSFNTVSRNNITNNYFGLNLRGSSNNRISGNNITNNEDSILLDWSSNNSVSGNNIKNNGHGVWLEYSSNNSISVNNITANDYYGIWLKGSSNNRISENNITNNNPGIRFYESSNNTICHNNFMDNTEQVYSYNSTNVWDDDYPSGGNYWSGYNGTDFYSGLYQNETGSDGIGDTPYVIDENNQDRYPLMNPWIPEEKVPEEIPPLVEDEEEEEKEFPFWTQWCFWTIVLAVIVVLAVAVYFLKKRKPPTPTAPPLPSESTRHLPRAPYVKPSPSKDLKVFLPSPRFLKLLHPSLSA